MSKFCLGNFGDALSDAETAGVGTYEYWRYYLIQLYGADIIARLNPTKITKTTKTGFITFRYSTYSEADQARLEEVRRKIGNILKSTWSTSSVGRDEHIRQQYDRYWYPEKYDTYKAGTTQTSSSLITDSGQLYTQDFKYGVSLPKTVLKSKYISTEGPEVVEPMVVVDELKESSVALAEVKENKKSNTLPLLVGAGVLGYFLLKD